MLRHWSQFVPNMSTDIRGHKALHRQHLHSCMTDKQQRMAPIVKDPVLTSTEARRPIRGGDEWENGDRRSSETSKQAPTRKTEDAVDCRQNNRILRQCLSGTGQRPPHHAIAVPTAMQNSHKDNVRSSAGGKQLKQQKSNSLSLARHHLPALDLFRASFFVRVQLTSLLSISPALCKVISYGYRHYK